VTGRREQAACGSANWRHELATATMTVDPSSGCCAPPHGCAFAKAVLARAVDCECALRRQVGEASVVDCGSPVAHHNCATLAALLHERARFALKLPPAGRLVMHAQALRLQCGGLQALQRHLGAAPDHDEGPADVHRMVHAAQQRHGSLAGLPWADLVTLTAQWTPRRRPPGGA